MLLQLPSCPSHLLPSVSVLLPHCMLRTSLSAQPMCTFHWRQLALAACTVAASMHCVQ